MKIAGRALSVLVFAYNLTAAAQSLRLYPEAVSLAGPGSTQHYVVMATGADGIDRDVTAEAALRSSNAQAVAVDATAGTLRGGREGTARIEALYRGQRASADVLVGSSRADLTVSFNPDILSILTTKGCNTAACHGSIAGKSGFKLSLFGYDSEADHDMIVNKHGGRRVQLTKPEESLLLKKPSYQTPHGGGKVLPVGSHDYETMLKWLRQGAPIRSTGPRLVRLEVYPPEQTLVGRAGGSRIIVLARLSDGTTRDMTGEVRFEAADEGVAKLDGDGVLQPGRSGLTTLRARGLGKAATAQVAVITAPAGTEFPTARTANFIDELVYRNQRRLNVPPAARSTDEEFLRRLYVDVVGRVPKPAERRAFLAAPDRSRLIDQLLADPEHLSYRTLKFEDWFRNTQLYSQGRAMGTFKSWIRDQVEIDRPYDEFVRELLTASGDTNRNPAAGFWFPAVDFMNNKFEVKQITPTVTRLFLGLRLECAECHNHPLENFTQNDFYGTAAFFGQMRMKVGNSVFRRIWYQDDSAQVEHPATHQPVAPKYLGGEEPAIPAGADRRVYFARWLTSPQNPYFARAIVNRIWHEYMGTGIVEPFDDMRSTNRPTNPELLARLAAYFVDQGFRLRELERLILNSETYQASSTPPAANGAPEELARLLFARYFPRKLPAEALLDSISQVTEAPQKYGGHPLGTTAKDYEIPDAPSYFLATFGFPRRDVLAHRNEEPTLAQALHLFSRTTLESKLTAQEGLISRLLARGAGDDEAVNEFYERAYARLPRESERVAVRTYLDSERAAGRSPRRVYENLLLVLLNTKEFQLNH
ncbi:MAG: DUF1553 domain-containing protein [Acidobacteriaceae bacterium]|nr:DUF1553 domain-containing protein [Acidobacteriaceae bacterium]